MIRFILLGCFSYLEKCEFQSCYKDGTCNTHGLPLTYIAYHLNGKTINMDGRLDDEAWAEVPWTEKFVGTVFNFIFKSKFKLIFFIL